MKTLTVPHVVFLTPTTKVAWELRTSFPCPHRFSQHLGLCSQPSSPITLHRSYKVSRGFHPPTNQVRWHPWKTGRYPLDFEEIVRCPGYLSVVWKGYVASPVAGWLVQKWGVLVWTVFGKSAVIYLPGTLWGASVGWCLSWTVWEVPANCYSPWTMWGISVGLVFKSSDTVLPYLIEQIITV